jgi:hypothetical protein
MGNGYQAELAGAIRSLNSLNLFGDKIINYHVTPDSWVAEVTNPQHLTGE